MKITREKSKELGFTAVNNQFISEFLPHLGGDAVRVYLTLTFYADQGINIDEKGMAGALGTDVSVVSAALIELESKGLVAREGNNVMIQELSDRFVQENFNKRASADKADKASAGSDRAQMLRALNNRFFGGQMSQAWYSDIVTAADKYGFCDEVIFMIFQQCNSVPLTRPYMRKVFDSYGVAGVQTVDEMNNWLQRREVFKKIRTNVAKNLKIATMTVYQEQYVEKWFYEYGYEMDIIDLALREASGRSNPGFALYDKILSDWHDAGLKTADEVKAHIAARKEARKESSGSGAKSSGSAGRKQNFDERKYDTSVYDKVYGEEK